MELLCVPPASNLPYVWPALAAAVRQAGQSTRVTEVIPRATTSLSVVCWQVYTGVLRLGQATSSYDAETAPTEERPWRHLSDADLGAGAAAMTGDLMQMPPMFSAIKVKGEVRLEANTCE